MKVTLESTTKLVTLMTHDGAVQARIWEGTTEGGIPCHAFITRIAVHRAENAAEFERELLPQRPVSPALDAAYPEGIPLRLVT